MDQDFTCSFPVGMTHRGNVAMLDEAKKPVAPADQKYLRAFLDLPIELRVVYDFFQ